MRLGSVFYDFEQSYLPAYQDSSIRKMLRERYVSVYLIRLLDSSTPRYRIARPFYRWVLEYMFYRRVSSFFVLYGK